MTHVFSPPTVDDLPAILVDPVMARQRQPHNRLFRHYKSRARGRTVLKNADGSYTTVDYPTSDQIDAARVAYLGGHLYEVSDAEAALLNAAGYPTTPGHLPSMSTYTGTQETSPFYTSQILPLRWDTIVGTWNDWAAYQVGTWDSVA